MNICHDCSQEIKKPENPTLASYTTGHATDADGNIVCFDCCGLRDEKEMKDANTGDKITLYLCATEEHHWKITNWPGTLNMIAQHHKTGRHNIADTRRDVWFLDTSGNWWWGVSYGRWTQLCHCKKLKKRPAFIAERQRKLSPFMFCSIV